MIWAVLDTNTIISGFGWGGPSADIIDRALDGQFMVVTSPALLAELERVMAYPKFKGLFSSGEQLVLLEAIAVVVEPTIELHVVVRDEDDNRVLEAAMTAEVDYIVSGDNDLLDLRYFEGIEIVQANDFLLRCLKD